jgi:GNAT superfamily N-acetyltransferase
LTADRFAIRRPRLSEQGAINELVQAVVDETYGGQWADPPLPIRPEDWMLGWAAFEGATPIGIVLATGDWIVDLWIARESRGLGLGAELLARAEAEIVERGYTLARLRVIATNVRARAFYERHDWYVDRRYPHASGAVEILELVKILG